MLKREFSFETMSDVSAHAPELLSGCVEFDPVPLYVGSIRQLRTDARATENYPSPGVKGRSPEGLPLAFTYPGLRPQGSFSLDGQSVSPIWTTAKEELNFYAGVDYNGNQEVWNIDDLLSHAEVPKMADRYPVITFGSNANPGQLVDKFKTLEGGDRYIVPTLKATIPGAMAVYVARLGLKGYVFADLVPTKDPETAMEVYVNFLSKSQFEAMDASEGAYDVCKLSRTDIVSDEGILQIPAYLYVGKQKTSDTAGAPRGAGILTDLEDRPIRLAEIRASDPHNEFAVMTQSEVQSFILDVAGKAINQNWKTGDHPITDPETLSEVMISRNKDDRLAKFRDDLSATNGALEAAGQKTIPLGRVVGQAVHDALVSVGRTANSVSIRANILSENQNIALEDRQTLRELV